MKSESEEKSKYKTQWPKEFERFGKDEKGNIIVPKVQYKIITDELGPCKQASMWINIKDKEYLIKNFTYDGGFTRRCDFIKYNGRANMHICKYNNLIVPYIGNIIFDIDTVKYFFVKFYDKAEGIKTNLEYLATFDEKIDGEELWEGANILNANKEGDTEDFSKRMEQIKVFLKLRHFSQAQIQSVTDEFIKQEIFKKTVEYRDNHNFNWCIGIDGKNVRLFPAYDFDLCSGIRKERPIYTYCDNGKTDIKSFIEQYKDLPWIKEYLKGVIARFSIEAVLQKVTQETKIEIPERTKKYFIDMYSEKKKKMEELYREIFIKRDKGDDER